MSAFASRAFRWLWCSSLVSSSANGMLATSMGWLALDEGGGGFGVGVVLAARMLPNLLFGLAAGTLADRSSRTRQLLAVSVAGLPIMLALNHLAATGSVAVWLLATLSFAAGCLPVFDAPARQALVMDIVPRDVAPNAMALNALATRLCFALGGFTAGVLIPITGVADGFLVISGLYVVSATLIGLVRPPRTHNPGLVRPTFAQAFGEAARLLVDVPAVRTLIAASIACEVFGFSVATAVPVVARDVLDAGAAGLGTLNAAISVGGTLAVVLLSTVPGRVRREPVLGAVFVLYGISLIALATATSLLAAAIVLVVTGACSASFDLLQQTLVQLAVPEEQRGRAMGVWVLGIGSAPIGHLEMGALVSGFGAPTGLVVNGTLVVLAALVLLARAQGYRLSGFGPAGSKPIR